MRIRIFLSWCHQDKALKEALLRDLLPALGVFTDLDVQWWEDSHLTCGEELTAGIVDRLDEAAFGLLLLATASSADRSSNNTSCRGSRVRVPTRGRCRSR